MTQYYENKRPKTLKTRPWSTFALTLYLIREELKSRKFFSGLQRLGLDYCFYQPHLGQTHPRRRGLDDPSDEVYKFYFKLIEKRGRKIRKDEESITKQRRESTRSWSAGNFGGEKNSGQ